VSGAKDILQCGLALFTRDSTLLQRQQAVVHSLNVLGQLRTKGSNQLFSNFCSKGHSVLLLAWLIY
jgi:hypothetical protein